VRLTFHGASVTQQSGAGSYVDSLREMLRHRPDVAIRKEGYGGSHLDDAGFMTLDADTRDVPDLCFLDWNTTSLAEFDEEKLRYMAGMLLDKGVVPVFLILAQPDSVSGMRRSERQVADLCAEAGLPCLDYRGLVSPETDLRDGTHTSPRGADIYAARLCEDMDAILARIDALRSLRIAYHPFAIRAVRGLRIDVRENEVIAIDLAECGPRAELVLEVLRGPASPIVDDGRRRVCVWDRWCHFERRGFLSFWRGGEEGGARAEVLLRVLPDAIDYSACQRPFSYTEEKELSILGVCGVDCVPGGFTILKVET